MTYKTLLYNLKSKCALVAQPLDYKFCKNILSLFKIFLSNCFNVRYPLQVHFVLTSI